ncbi:kinetochore protein Nuf2 [Etheostoma cragini]|uniref:kinetochore protein Nuf2 n=1 Tax=Etheostoma cragini TaxID=417921 RepID=UPI00155E6F1A|nr:kinetochore protein Nuf2 [Etheostoma cragini]
MAENTFPIYSADAVVNFYRTEVLTGQEAKHFTKSDLTPVPKPEAVQTLYMRVLHLLYRFRPECHSMVPLLENIQNPEYHEGATAIMSVYMRMQQFLPICLVYDFSLSDLLAPKKQKTLTILSGIMNFLHFRKQRMSVISEKQAKFRADMDRLQFFTKGIAEAKAKIAMLTNIPPEQQAEADELATALSELQAATKHECQEVNAMNESIAEWKTKIAEKTQKLAQVKVDVSNLKEDIGKLKSQIVESPEELKSEMEKMRENVKNIKFSIEETDERVVELQNLGQAVSHSVAEIQQMYNLLQDLESSMNNTKQRQEEVRTRDSHPAHKKHQSMMREIKGALLCVQAVYDTLSASMDELHRRIEKQTSDLKQDVTKMSENF